MNPDPDPRPSQRTLVTDSKTDDAKVESADRHRILPHFDDYTIIRELGRGGMGVVYEAFQESLRRRVALKALPTGGLPNACAIERFQTEARAAGKLNHEHIVRVFEVGWQDATMFYAMDFIEGQD